MGDITLADIALAIGDRVTGVAEADLSSTYPAQGRVCKTTDTGTVYWGNGLQWIDISGAGTLSLPSVDVSGTVDVNGNDIQNAGSVGADEVAVSEVAARAYQSSNQSVPDSTFTQLEYGNTSFDEFGGWDLPNDQFVVQRSGMYLVINSVRMSLPDGSRVIARIDVNGNEIARADSHAAKASSTVAGRVSDVVRLSAGDTITGFVYQDSGGSQSTNADETFIYLTVTKLG